VKAQSADIIFSGGGWESMHHGCKSQGGGHFTGEAGVETLPPRKTTFYPPAPLLVI